MGPNTTHIYPIKMISRLVAVILFHEGLGIIQRCFIKKFRFYNPLSNTQNDNFSVYGYGRGGVGPRTTNLYYQKGDL